MSGWTCLAFALVCIADRVDGEVDFNLAFLTKSKSKSMLMLNRAAVGKYGNQVAGGVGSSTVGGSQVVCSAGGVLCFDLLRSAVLYSVLFYAEVGSGQSQEEAYGANKNTKPSSSFWVIDCLVA
mmetsp:Transcript_24519/g.68335  ORF Transcript_24519/g.68335 Transcript_24519/m.68335 type:complete len:124 (+) Transcript_24519:1019-1390(+)